jgi:hypothetical protein
MRRKQEVGRIADAIVAACEAWPTVNGYVPCHYKQGCGCEMVPARVRAALGVAREWGDAERAPERERSGRA